MARKDAQVVTDVWVPYINLTDVFSAKVEDMRLFAASGGSADESRCGNKCDCQKYVFIVIVYQASEHHTIGFNSLFNWCTVIL